jgi:dTDP-4-dehydrorhamnose reductase
MPDPPSASPVATCRPRRLLILGSTGLLGQALMAEARLRDWSCMGGARHGANYDVDVTDGAALEAVIRGCSPQVIVNCVAVTDHRACEQAPGRAYLVNARAPALLAELSAELGVLLVHISTDHYYTGDGHTPHDEHAPVRLVNEYARTKFAGERMVLTNPAALVVRTNFVGLRHWPDRPTFAEWALEMITNKRPMTLFDDFFTSSIHAPACAAAILDLISAGTNGLINVASSQVSSKLAFVQALAQQLTTCIDQAGVGSVRQIVPRRAESLGLDVTRAQQVLGRTLPGLQETVAAIAREFDWTKQHEIQI